MFIVFYILSIDSITLNRVNCLLARRGMQAELDNLMLQVKNSEEKARKAAVDAGKAGIYV